MSGIFSKPKTRKITDVPKREDEEIQKAAEKKRRSLANRKGRSSTVLGGTIGSIDNVQRRDLLG